MDVRRDLNQEQTENKIGRSKTKTNGSEAAKKIQRILRRNPNTGPAELAAKAGVSKKLVKALYGVDIVEI